MQNLAEIKEPIAVPFDGKIVPYYYANRLLMGGRDDIGLCTLWTTPKNLERLTDSATYALRGPLYSPRGAEYLLRNVLANPSIRVVLIAGANANNSGDALTSLVKNGINEKGEIVGLVNERGRALVTFDPWITTDIVDRFRNSVRVEDHAEEPWDEVNLWMRGIPSQKRFSNERLFFPETIPSTNSMPSEKMGIRIERKTIADAWLDMLKHIRTFGEMKPSDKGRNLQELASLHIVVDDDPRTMLDKFPDWLPIGKFDVEKYLPMMLDKKPLRGTERAYTYGAALQDFFGDSNYDQIEKITKLIGEEWYTKRAYATTWHLPENLDDQVSSAPCLTDLNFLVQDDKLFMSAHFRSHDMYRAWLENVYALRFLQSRMVENLKDQGIGLGKMEVISNSAHLWQDIIPDADRLISQEFPKLALRWNEDQRGGFLITVEHNRIKMVHVDAGGNLTGRIYEGTNDQNIYRQAILQDLLVSDPSHGAYLGRELFRAKLALDAGKSYEQEQA